MADALFERDGLGKYKAEGRFLDGYPGGERAFFARGMTSTACWSRCRAAQMSLDRSQAGGVHEKQTLARWDNEASGNSIAIGTSSVHNAISHPEIVIVDGVYTVKGSTNWSLPGEQQQDNELTLSRNAVIAAETRAILDLNHDFMLKQMVGIKPDVKKLLAPKTKDAMPPLPPGSPAAEPVSPAR